MENRIREWYAGSMESLCAWNVRYGYYWDYEAKRMGVNGEEAAVVRQVFEWYALYHLKVAEIARRLEAQGVRSKRTGKPIPAGTISRWLKDEAYVGIFYRYRKSGIGTGWEVVPGPAIVSDELFGQAKGWHMECRNRSRAPA